MAIVAAFTLVLGTVATMAWALWLIRAGARDSGALAGKLRIPVPTRAAEWPELRLDAVVPDPDGVPSVLVLARWPAHPESRALLVLDLDAGAAHARRLLMRWRDTNASLTPEPVADGGLMLRRRRTPDAVCVLVVRETTLAVES